MKTLMDVFLFLGTLTFNDAEAVPNFSCIRFYKLQKKKEINEKILYHCSLHVKHTLQPKTNLYFY